MQCGQADNSAEQFHDRVQLGAQQRFHSMQPLRVGMTSWSTPAGAWRKLAALINLRSPTIRKQVWRLHNKRRRLLFWERESFFFGRLVEKPQIERQVNQRRTFTYIEPNMRPERQRNAAAARASSRNVT